MNTLQGVVLGVVQGLAEFLPVSSSAHLTVVPRLFGWPDAGLAFDVWLHWGTLLAVLVYCSRDFLSSYRTGQLPDGLLWLIGLGTIPGAIAGYLLQHQAETVFRTTPALIALAMILLGLILAWADRRGIERREFSTITWRDSLIIGCSQALAVIPGVSRSGVTISAALFLGIARPAAARFSFWLSLPIIFGAGLVEIPKLLHGKGVGLTGIWGPPALLGFLAAALSGFVSIHVLLRYVQRHRYTPFVIYRLLFGAFVLIALFTHRL
ncbi:MAG: undecaprenyl-diphosphatase UppP [Elusimicrobia bacterium]|nr:undecaprenyl-diphosphatase UppP [Elusimicrobiota bacterium]